MEWISSIRAAIDYIENNILSVGGVEEISSHIAVSPYYLQTGFKIMTGYSIGEYIRNRRLYLAALDLCSDKYKVIDIALKYGYDTPESFTKAFARFHSATPSQLRKNPQKLTVFLPLKIFVTVKGGYDMDYIVEKMQGFKVIGFAKEFSYENESSYAEIPKFWNELSEKYFQKLWSGKQTPNSDIEKAIAQYGIGLYGVCIDDNPELCTQGKFLYLIAGNYTGGDIPDGLTVYEFPDVEWAKFLCKGAIPTALQSINTKIFKEWLPGNTEYEIALPANIEWYSNGDPTSSDYESAIWVPVQKK